VGAYAQIIGPIRIGDGCRIGAMTAVVKDLPAGAIAVGQSARILNSMSGDDDGND
jgi:serine O-acetyltransferase